MSNLAASQSGHELDLLAKILKNSEESIALSHDLSIIQRNQDYLKLLSKLGTESEAILNVKPDELKGALALEFLNAKDDGQRIAIHQELQRWALYFSDSLEEVNEFISSINSGALSDSASISEIALMTQELVDIAEDMFIN